VGTKKREIDRPFKTRKKKLRKVNKILQKRLPVHSNAFCGVPGLSRHKALARHLGRKFYVVRDLENCYPSISIESIISRLVALGIDGETAEIISKLFTVRGRISQGSPLSGLALNVYMYSFDQKITENAARLGGRYCRYGDDMIVSFMDSTSANTFSGIIDSAIADYGLSINKKKLSERGFQTAGCQVELLGLVVNNPRGTRIPKHKQQESTQFAQKYLRAATSVDPDSLPTVASYRNRLMGIINDARQAHFSNAHHLYEILIIGDRRVANRLQKLGISAYKSKWWLKGGRRKLKGGRRDEPARIAALWRNIKRIETTQQVS
jgi:hypothetical protein